MNQKYPFYNNIISSTLKFDGREKKGKSVAMMDIDKIKIKCRLESLLSFACVAYLYWC